MPVLVDPEEFEIQALIPLLGNRAGKSVLEIGCGDGRLTWRYAHDAGSVVGIDPKAERITQANQNLADDLRSRVAFHALSLEDYAAGIGKNERFDLALLSWSL